MQSCHRRKKQNGTTHKKHSTIMVAVMRGQSSKTRATQDIRPAPSDNLTTAQTVANNSTARIVANSATARIVANRATARIVAKNNSISLVTTRKYPQIDLEKEIPPLDEIFKRTVIVTAISSNHYKEGKVMISTAQNVMPNTRIVVCDLGLIPSEIRELSTFCNVEVRSFKFSKYPPHVKDLLNYAWKPALIKELLYEFGAVFWADSSVRFRRSILLLTDHLKTFHGFIPQVANYDSSGTFSVVDLTHPAMFDYLKVDIDTFRKDTGFTPKPRGGILYFVNSSYINEKLLQPWVDCSMVIECIAPHGSQNPHKKKMKGYYVHRYDQSALAILMYKNLRGLYHIGHDATKTFKSVMRVENSGHSYITNKVKICKKKILT
ncbi:uncharacterized protein LOC117290413 isoform X2 [Asterias rubens]|uniref:uncharacterized protein LOC117290413 isoform X2 n=1 Tax=Asterias rubens TaxID=7604 RepID=UPI001455D970|nr:uncharacterized protein LOC117290413 isoform X2 [Asterias rubens]